MATAHAYRREMPTTEELGRRIKHLREKEGLTLRDIAIRAKMRDEELATFEDEGRIEGRSLLRLIDAVSEDQDIHGAFERLAPHRHDLTTLPGVLDAWSAGQITSREAIRHARLDSFQDLLQTATENEVPLPQPSTRDRGNAAQLASMLER